MRPTAVFIVVVLAFAAGGGVVWLSGASHDMRPASGTASEASSKAIVERSTIRVTPSPIAPSDNPDDIADIKERLLALRDVASDFDQTAGLYVLLGPLDTNDLVDLLDYSAVAFSGGDYYGATRVIIGRLAELDPDLAIALAESESGQRQRQWLSSIFHALARLDLADARKRAEALPQHLKPQVAQALIRSRHDLALGEQTDIASSLGLRQVPVGSIEDYASAWSEAKGLRSPNQRIQRLMQILHEWSQSDPQAALLAAQQERGRYAQHLVSQVVAQWSRSDPDAALGWLHAQPWDRRTSQQHYQSVYAHFAQEDPEAALMWAQTLTGDQRDAALLGVLPALASHDPGVALNALEDIEGQTRGRLLQQIAVNAAMADPASLDVILDRIGDDERDQMLRMAVSMMAHQDPEAAAARLSEIGDATERRNIARQVVGQWAQQDLDGAIAWVEDAATDDRPNLYQGVTEQWGHSDLDEAYAFARSLRNGDERDAALMGAMNGAYEDAEVARQIYDDIGNQEVREQGAWMLYRVLQQADPGEAERFRVEAGLETDEAGLQGAGNYSTRIYADG